MKICSAVLELFNADRRTDGTVLIGVTQECEHDKQCDSLKNDP
jgi:hypothetical protein